MARIKWKGTVSDTNRTLVRKVPGVKASMRAKVEMMKPVAEANLAPHHAHNAPLRDHGDSISHIETSSGRVDAYLSLVDTDGGAAAIEAQLAPLKRAAFAGVGGRPAWIKQGQIWDANRKARERAR